MKVFFETCVLLLSENHITRVKSLQVWCNRSAMMCGDGGHATRVIKLYSVWCIQFTVSVSYRQMRGHCSVKTQVERERESNHLVADRKLQWAELFCPFVQCGVAFRRPAGPIQFQHAIHLINASVDGSVKWSKVTIMSYAERWSRLTSQVCRTQAVPPLRAAQCSTPAIWTTPWCVCRAWSAWPTPVFECSSTDPQCVPV